MTVSHVSTSLFNNVSGSYFELVYTQASIAAITADKIVVDVFWKEDSAQAISSIMWGAQPLSIEGIKFSGPGGSIARYSCIASSSTTANIVLTFDNYCYCNAYVMVSRDSGGGVISLSTLQSQKYDSGGYVAPSLTNPTVPAGALSVSALFSTAYDTGFSPFPATTWSGSDTARGNIQNTATNSIGRAYVQTAAGAGSNITHAWAASPASNLMYSHFAYYLSAAAANSLATLSAGAVVGGTGYSGTTIGMAAITSLTNATITGTSTNAFTYSMNGFVHGSAYLDVGTPTFTCGDGTLTATKASPLATMAGYTAVAMSTMDTGLWSLGKDPAVVSGTKVHLPTAAGTLNPDGTVTDYIVGVYTAWIRDLLGIMYTFTVTITDAGIGVSSIKRRSIGFGIGQGL